MEATEIFAQRQDIKTRLVDGEAFLITRTTIKHLNPTATLIWSVIEIPLSEDDIFNTVHELLPSIDQFVLRSDIGLCLEEFRELGIISIKH
jgi:hypothetical protein